LLSIAGCVTHHAANEEVMCDLLTVIFEAHHAERNYHRRYQITISRDLFDDWVVRISYGRIGRRGNAQQFGHADADKVRSIVRERLRRRLSAPRRIDCAYRMCEIAAAEGIDPADWLPAEVMCKLLTPAAGSGSHDMNMTGRLAMGPRDADSHVAA